MKKVKVVAHTYTEGSDDSYRKYNESYFPIGAVCQCDDDGLVTSPIHDTSQYVNQSTMIASTSHSAIVFQSLDL